MQVSIKHISIISIVRVILAVIYIIFILHMTLMNRTVNPNHIFYGMFWELKNHMWGDIFKNIALFVPFGFIVGGRKGVVFGLLFSCGIEITQYITREYIRESYHTEKLVFIRVSMEFINKK